MNVVGQYERHCPECEGTTWHRKDVQGLHIQWTCRNCGNVSECTIEQAPPPSPICEATVERIRKNVQDAILTDGTDDLLAERERTHGDFEEVAGLAQTIKAEMRHWQGWRRLTERQAESLDMIAAKMARIVCGDGGYPDHWRDIEGYARLAAPTAD